jgi:hypothetical protein
MRSSQWRALYAALIVAVSCAALGVAAAQTPPAPLSASAPEPSPLPVLARYSMGAYVWQLAWSPDSARVALTGVHLDDRRWVMIYGALPSSVPLRVQEDVGAWDNPTRALWLDPTHLAVIDLMGQRVWEVTADGVKPADLARLNALTPEQIQRALDDQCVRHDPARGLRVISDGIQQGLRWSHPMQPRDLWLGDIASRDDHLLPCVSRDGAAVAFMTATNQGEAQLALASLAGQATPSKEPAPALWGAWTHAQLLAAIYPTGAPNEPNFTLEVLPWPGRADAVAVLTYGHAHRRDALAHIHVLTQAGDKLQVAATTALLLIESDSLDIKMAASPVVFHDKEGALLVTRRFESEGEVGSWGSEKWSYLRWHDDKLDVILSFDHSAHHDSCGSDSESSRTLTALKPAHDGFHDVRVAGTETNTDYGVEGEPTPVTTTIKETWRWDGTQYQPVK